MDKCGDKGLTFLAQKDIIREVLIKSGMQIAQTDFSSGGCRPQDCMKMTQEYLMYFEEFSCKMAENMQARCVPRFIQCFLRKITAENDILRKHGRLQCAMKKICRNCR